VGLRIARLTTNSLVHAITIGGVKSLHPRAATSKGNWESCGVLHWETGKTRAFPGRPSAAEALAAGNRVAAAQRSRQIRFVWFFALQNTSSAFVWTCPSLTCWLSSTLALTFGMWP